MVRTLGFHCHGPGSFSGQGTETLRDMRCCRKKKRETRNTHMCLRNGLSTTASKPPNREKVFLFHKWGTNRTTTGNKEAIPINTVTIHDRSQTETYREATRLLKTITDRNTLSLQSGAKTITTKEKISQVKTSSKSKPPTYVAELMEERPLKKKKSNREITDEDGGEGM